MYFASELHMDPEKKQYILKKFMKIELDEDVTIEDILSEDCYADVVEAIEHIIENVMVSM